MSDIAHVLERVRQNRAQQLAALPRATPASASINTRAPGGLTAGARVFDTVSGMAGEVLDASRENIILPSAGRANG